MRRSIELVATSDGPVGADTGHVDVDPNGSPYGGSPGMSMAKAWTDPIAGMPCFATSSYTGGYVHWWPGPASTALARAYVYWSRPPTMVLFRKVTITAEWDYAQGGPNNWYFPPDNGHGPALYLSIGDRAGTGWLDSPTPQIITGGDIITRNCKDYQCCGASYGGTLTHTWEMLSHPEGGPWTFDDLKENHFLAGVVWSVAGPVFDNSQGSFFKIRVHRVRVFLEVEDLGGFMTDVRHSTSLSARYFRRARNAILIKNRADRARGVMLGHVNLSHPRGFEVGSQGWGERRLERRAGVLVQRKIWPENMLIEDELFDQRAYACLLWSAYRIDAPWDPNLTGWAYLDKGLGWTHTRLQDAWSPRPGDGALMRVLGADGTVYPNLSFHGLACQGGGDVELVLRNYDLMQSGWSNAMVSGGLTITEDTSFTMVEELGYQSSARFDFPSGGGSGGRERSIGTLPRASGERVHLRTIVKNTSVVTPATQFLEVGFVRSGGGMPAAQYWDATARVWTTTATYNKIPSDVPSGEFVSDAIPVDAPTATSDPTYTVRVGRFSSSMANAVFHGAVVNVQRGGGYGARTPLVSLDATITRVADVHTVTNDTVKQVWDYERGVAVAEFRPFFRTASMPAASVKPVLHARHSTAGTGSWDALQIVTGSPHVVRFERAINGQPTFQLDCPISGELDRTKLVRVWARWLGIDGWTEFAPYSVEVGYAVFDEETGALLVEGSQIGTLTSTGVVSPREWVRIGCDDQTRFLDAYMRMIEVRRNPISELEAVWKL